MVSVLPRPMQSSLAVVVSLLSRVMQYLVVLTCNAVVSLLSSAMQRFRCSFIIQVVFKLLFHSSSCTPHVVLCDVVVSLAVRYSGLAIVSCSGVISLLSNAILLSRYCLVRYRGIAVASGDTVVSLVSRAI